jgi:hypothetical protein
MDRFSYGKQLIEAAQVRQRHPHVTKGIDEVTGNRRGRGVPAFGAALILVGESLDPLDDSIGVQVFRRWTPLNGPLHARDGMLDEQLQNADVLPRTGVRAVTLFQTFAQVRKVRRQLPLPIDVGVIKGGRTPTQHGQVVDRIENLLTGKVTS